MSGLASAFVTREALVGRTGCDGFDALSALVERAREGDGRAFDRLMIETQERVVGLAWRLLGSREDAHDAAQEVYLRVFRHLDGFRAGHDFHGWLYRITINVCRDAARRRRRAPVSDAAVAERGEAPKRRRRCSERNGGRAFSEHWGLSRPKSARRSCCAISRVSRASRWRACLGHVPAPCEADRVGADEDAEPMCGPA